jgi:AcrR family transcriptional regulator
MTVATKLTRSERAALTRRELLDVARRRFYADGYHATTLDDIADEAGYTKGAVYSTFKSKAGLFLALFDEVVDTTVEGMRALLASHATSEARIEAVARNPVDERNLQFRLLAIEFWVHAARDPQLLAAFSSSYRRLRSKLAELAPDGGAGDAERWAILTLAFSNGLALERLIDPDGVPDDLMGDVQRQLQRSGPVADG